MTRVAISLQRHIVSDISATFAFVYVQYLPLVQVVKPEILVVQVVGKVVVEKNLLTTSPSTEVSLNGQYLIPYVVFLL